MLQGSPGRRPYPPAQRAWLAALACLAALLGACGARESASSPCATASCVDLQLEGAALSRPPARFEHEAHVKALAPNSCAACHASPKDGDFSLKGVAPAATTSVSIRTDQTHGLCMGCHQRLVSEGKKAGPELCGECHRGSETAAPTQSPVAMDLSLHQRHVAAHANKCDGCHHVYDEAAHKLVYRKGEESSCRDCHAKAPEGNKPSWRRAAHSACVGCHLKDALEGRKAGPTDCGGCHDPATLRSVKRLDPVPRLDRGQPAWVWMRAPWATTSTVAFPHAKHEATARACSTCHHHTLRRCEDCHTAEGKAEGGGVTLETALHDVSSARSCVGCHERRAASESQCAGCHDGSGARSREAACATCHNSADHPRAAAADDPQAQQPALAPLPTGPDVPDKDLELKELARRYQGAKLPHPKILARLDKAIRASALATYYHATPTALCAGCHHHEAQDAKASKCTSCHGGEDDAVRDRPSAVQAYHRQCVGCHERMGIKAVGCTDCHAKAEAKQ